MLKQVFLASALVALASSASEARPSRIVGQASGCNVTMPCDFSFSQTRRVTINTINPYSQGQTEGRINKLKLLKRSMYGRGKFDLLRQRVLYAVG